MTIESNFRSQCFPNGYALVNGVALNAENPESFQIPHAVLKKHVCSGHFIELRIDSSRFSVHQESGQKCFCSACNGEMSKPILGHQHPASLVNIPAQKVPSRGWGEDFWVRVSQRDDHWFEATVDNDLAESRLHEINRGDTVYFHEDHILAVHGIHRESMVLGMDAADLKTLAEWLLDQQA